MYEFTSHSLCDMVKETLLPALLAEERRAGAQCITALHASWSARKARALGAQEKQVHSERLLDRAGTGLLGLGDFCITSVSAQQEYIALIFSAQIKCQKKIPDAWICTYFFFTDK
jgi:hypothetical protein